MAIAPSAADRLDEPRLVRRERRAPAPAEREEAQELLARRMSGTVTKPGSGSPGRRRARRARASSRPCDRAHDEVARRLVGEEHCAAPRAAERRALRRSASARRSGSSSSVDARVRPRSTRNDSSRARRSASALTASSRWSASIASASSMRRAFRSVTAASVSLYVRASRPSSSSLSTGTRCRKSPACARFIAATSRFSGFRTSSRMTST